MSQYWREALSLALESEGLDGRLTPDEVNAIGDALAVSAENESLCHAPVSNPLSSEIYALKQKIEASEESARKREDSWRKGFARMTRLDPDRIYIDRGEIMVRRR